MTNRVRARGRGIRLLSWAAAFALVGILSGCWNGGGFQNSGVMGVGGRFALVIEPARTSVDGTHFLVDTATGDLWRLDVAPASAQRWVRVSAGPTDVKKLQLPDLLLSGGAQAEVE